MSILEGKNPGRRERTAITYLGIAVFCLLFYLIYNFFSHGVHSPFMTWLFLWPLVLGVFPCVFLKWCPWFRRPGFFARNLYHSGVAAVTVSSMLRGIFEIAGTASDYQEWLMWAGGIMLVCAVLVYLLGIGSHDTDTD